MTDKGRGAVQCGNLPPCGGDARQGRGGCGRESHSTPSSAAPHPPLSPSATSPPQGGRSIGVRSSPILPASTVKRASLIAGLILLLVLWAILLPFSDRASFTIHMIAHMGVVAGVAPLIAVGLSGTRADLPARWPWFTPVVASVIELMAVWAWHIPVLRALSESSPVVAALEQLTFLVAGLGLWLSCLGGLEAGKDGRRLAGAFGLLFTSMHMTLLGALLALSPRPLYGDAEVTCFGFTLSPVVDQQAGGVIMLLVGAAVYLAGGVSLLAATLNSGVPQPSRRRD
jgi:putative membrane protein